MLYGSVSARDIFEALRDMDVKVERSQIDLPQPIKNVGVYDVRIVLHPDVSENIKVTVARSGEEANKLAASYNSDLVKPVEETNEEVVVAETEETVEA
jgi:large subunit ribosomal protein L9